MKLCEPDSEDRRLDHTRVPFEDEHPSQNIASGGSRNNMKSGISAIGQGRDGRDDDSAEAEHAAKRVRTEGAEEPAGPGVKSTAAASREEYSNVIREIENLCGSDELSLDRLQEAIDGLPPENPGVPLDGSNMLHRAVRNPAVTTDIVRRLLRLCPGLAHVRLGFGVSPARGVPQPLV